MAIINISGIPLEEVILALYENIPIKQHVDSVINHHPTLSTDEICLAIKGQTLINKIGNVNFMLDISHVMLNGTINTDFYDELHKIGKNGTKTSKEVIDNLKETRLRKVTEEEREEKKPVRLIQHRSINPSFFVPKDAGNHKRLSPLSVFQAEMEKFNQQARSSAKDILIHAPYPEIRIYDPQTLTAISKKLYEFTKLFLNVHKERLCSEEKGALLNLYIETWKKNQCKLSIEHTAYASEYLLGPSGRNKQLPSGQSYRDEIPMTAGFNLSAAYLTVSLHDLIFFRVNFNGANFSTVELPYSLFENCNLDEITSTKKTNLNQCKFMNCKMNSNDFTKVQFDGVHMERCTIINTQIPFRTFDYECITELPTTTLERGLSRPSF